MTFSLLNSKKNRRIVLLITILLMIIHIKIFKSSCLISFWHMIIFFFPRYFMLRSRETSHCRFPNSESLGSAHQWDRHGFFTKTLVHLVFSIVFDILSCRKILWTRRDGSSNCITTVSVLQRLSCTRKLSPLCQLQILLRVCPFVVLSTRNVD